MAGMYPDNENLEFFGEAVSWPGVDENGKFTNGNFSNPAEPPSYIPAQTINLILDNLSELLLALGKNPNNQSTDQLAAAVTAAINAEAQERTTADQNLLAAILAISPEIENNVQTVLNILEEIRNLINTHKTAAVLDHPNGSVTFAKIAAAAKSTTAPKISGTAAVGTESAFARGDHIHPTEFTAKNLGSVDFNSVVTPGNYIVTNSSTNTPSDASTSWRVFVWGSDNTFIQEATYYSATPGSGLRWWRKCENGAWQPWQKLPQDIPVNSGGASQTDLLKMVSIQSGNLMFLGYWEFSSEGVLTKSNNSRIISVPVAKTQSTDGFIDWLLNGTAWPAITGLGSTPNIAGGHSITISPWTAIIGRHARGGLRNAVAFYALNYIQTNVTDLLQPGDIFICTRLGDTSTDNLLLGNGTIIGDGVVIYDGSIVDTRKANTASPVFTGTPKITDANGSQNRIAVVAMTSDPFAKNLPVGSYVLVKVTSQISIPLNGDSNNNATPALSNNNDYIVTDVYGANGASVLSGTWKCSGISSAFMISSSETVKITLWRRVA